jgi:hypothetical protein
MSPPRRPKPIRKIRLKITVDGDDAMLEGLRSLEGVVTAGKRASLTVTADTPEKALAEIKRLADALLRPAKPEQV